MNVICWWVYLQPLLFEGSIAFLTNLICLHEVMCNVCWGCPCCRNVNEALVLRKGIDPSLDEVRLLIFLGMSAWWTPDFLPSTMPLNWPRIPLQCSVVMSYRLTTPALRLNCDATPGVYVSLFTVTSVIWSTGILPTELLLDIWTAFLKASYTQGGRFVISA